VPVVALGFAACAGGAGAGKVAPKKSLVGLWEGIPVKHKIVFKDRQFWLFTGKDTTKPVEAYRLADTTTTPKSKHLASLTQCSSAIRQAMKAAAPKPAMPPKNP
jgi:hypothetical protein